MGKPKRVYDGYRIPPSEGDRGGNLRKNDIDRIIALYKSGEKVFFISKSCNCSQFTVNRTVRKYGIEKRFPTRGIPKGRKGKVNNNV